jgi:(p)ppGpp synthase/HD superfamily hydrolase
MAAAISFPWNQTYFTLLDSDVGFSDFVSSEQMRRIADEQVSHEGETAQRFHALETTLLELARVRLDRDGLVSVAGAYDFAKGIKYHHVGLTPVAYLMHPMRVTCYALLINDRPSVELVLTALLHNVLEVSDVSSEKIRKEFGTEVAKNLENLTIDRKRSDRKHPDCDSYISSYYRGIIECGSVARIVKSLDKYDNLFMICFNGDGDVRTHYLDDIERNVIPLASREHQQFGLHMQALLRHMRVLGGRSKSSQHLL